MINQINNINCFNTLLSSPAYESINNIYRFHYYAYYYIRINHIHITNIYNRDGVFLYRNCKTYSEKPKLSNILYLGSKYLDDYK